MKNTFGNSLCLTLFGESHGKYVGATLDGIAPGIEINEDYINTKMQKRASSSLYTTDRREKDEFEFISGIYNNRTTGTPLTVLIKNKDTDSSYYEDMPFRPSHADFTGFVKYHGFEDPRGGGHFSGRLTAPIVALGAVISYALEKKSIYSLTHIKSLYDIPDREILDFSDDRKILDSKDFPVLSSESENRMKELILKTKNEGNSLGGISETVVGNIPAGVGEPFFDSCESMIAHVLFSIPGIKGVEFGKGFSIAQMTGKEANDEFVFDKKVKTLSNNSGGIQGGITNSMPIIVRCAVKPTPSISIPQKTLTRNVKETEYSVNGRHDPAIIVRATSVIDSSVTIALADLLVQRNGTDYLSY